MTTKRPALVASDESDAELRERVLTTGRPANGRIKSLRLIEGDDGLYSVMVSVSWRPGSFLLRQRDTSEVKRYKDLSSLMKRCRETYRFDGPISVETEKGN